MQVYTVCIHDLLYIFHNISTSYSHPKMCKIIMIRMYRISYEYPIHTNWQPERLCKRITQYMRWQNALFSSALAAPFRWALAHCKKAQWLMALLFCFPSTGKTDSMYFWNSAAKWCVVRSAHSCRMKWNGCRITWRIKFRFDLAGCIMGRPVTHPAAWWHNRATVVQPYRTYRMRLNFCGTKLLQSLQFGRPSTNSLICKYFEQ